VHPEAPTTAPEHPRPFRVRGIAVLGVAGLVIFLGARPRGVALGRRSFNPAPLIIIAVCAAISASYVLFVLPKVRLPRRGAEPLRPADGRRGRSLSIRAPATCPRPAPDGAARLAGGTIFGSVTGTATPGVLALHGWARSHKDFDATLAPADGATLDAVALDLPGFGATPAPPEVWGAAEYAAFVAGVLDEMAAPVVVLGHSFGGKSGRGARRAAPRGGARPRADRCPTGGDQGPVQPARAFALMRRAHRLGLVSDARMEAARQRYGSADYRAAEGVMRQILVKSVGSTTTPSSPRHVPGRARLGRPRHCLAAGRGRARRRAAQLRAPDRPAGVGHMTPLEAPRELRAALDRLGAR